VSYEEEDTYLTVRQRHSWEAHVCHMRRRIHT